MERFLLLFLVVPWAFSFVAAFVANLPFLLQDGPTHPVERLIYFPLLFAGLYLIRFVVWWRVVEFDVKGNYWYISASREISEFGGPFAIILIAAIFGLWASEQVGWIVPH